MEINDSHASTDTNSVSLSLQPEPSNSPPCTSNLRNQSEPPKHSNKRKLESTNTHSNISSTQPPNKKRKMKDILSKFFAENKQLKKQNNSLENDMITMDKTHNKLLLQNKLLIKQNNEWRQIFNKIINTINEDNTIKNKLNPLQLNNITNINLNVNTNKSMHKSHQITNYNMNTNNMNILNTNINTNSNLNTNINNTNNTNKNIYNYSGSDMELENNDNDMDYINIKSNVNVKEELNDLHAVFEDKIFVKKEFESNDINRNKKKKMKIELKVKKRKKKKCNDVSDDNSKDIVYNTDRPRTRNTMKMRHEHFKKAQKEYNKLQKDTILNGDNKQVDIVLLE